jgi:hypothetical protein
MRAAIPTPAPMPAFAPVLRPLELELLDVSPEGEDVGDALLGEVFVAVGSCVRISIYSGEERAGLSYVGGGVLLVVNLGYGFEVETLP